MATFVRISALLWADLLAAFAMFVLMTYLTNVWNLSTTHAAGIINIWNGITSILPIAFAFFVDAFMGNYLMLLQSSIAYSIGLGLLSMSTPPVTGPCHEYKEECVGHKQKALLYVALALIAVGMSGHVVSLSSFLVQQNEYIDKNDNESINIKKTEEEIEGGNKIFCQIPGAFGVVVVAIVGGIGLPYIKPWSIRFGIPAICSLVATLLFLTGSLSYKYIKPNGSPLTTTLRVFVAAASKISQPSPESKQLYNEDDVRSTSSLRCLNKAALELPPVPQEGQKSRKWELCSVREVEETKIGIRMVPMWVTFIVIGLVLSIGTTYFLEQANHMDRKLGRVTIPIPIFLLFYKCSSSASVCFYKKLESHLPRKYAPPVGIVISMVFSVLCCITAAKVETRRLHGIRDHGLLDKPNERIPMSIFWLLPQFVLLAALNGLANTSITGFFQNQVPKSMHEDLTSKNQVPKSINDEDLTSKNQVPKSMHEDLTSKNQVPKYLHEYLPYFTKGVLGLGTMASVLSVYVVGKFSERNQKPNWFQFTLNKSRLDRYYWVLAALSAINLVIYIIIACFYKYKDSESNNGAETEVPELPENSQEDSTNCFCC